MEKQEYLIHDDTEYNDLKAKLSPEEYQEYIEMIKNVPQTINRVN